MGDKRLLKEIVAEFESKVGPEGVELYRWSEWHGHHLRSIDVPVPGEPLDPFDPPPLEAGPRIAMCRVEPEYDLTDGLFIGLDHEHRVGVVFFLYEQGEPVASEPE